MKKTILTGASILTLVVAGPAFAQSTSTVNQTGNGNSAGVTQTGDNLSEIDQVGDGNSATADQSGSSNESDIDQTATGSNIASVSQAGEDSFADVIQDGASNGSNASISQGAGTSAATTGEVTQTSAVNSTGIINQDNGAASFAAIQQGDTPQFGGTVATAENASSTITQSGSANIALTVQGGVGQTSFIEQTGLDGMNDATVFQGTSNGDGNNTFIQQLGTSDSISVLQNSDGNTAFVVQIGTGMGNVGSIEQGTFVGGGGNSAAILQEGAGNESTITQNVLAAGGGNTAENEQIGDGATSIISQEGMGNMADVNQFGAHTSTVTQTGDGNTANVTQGTAPIPVMIVN